MPPLPSLSRGRGGTVMKARVFVADLGPWPRGATLLARTPFVETVSWLGGRTLYVLVPTDRTTPRRSFSRRRRSPKNHNRKHLCRAT